MRRAAALVAVLACLVGCAPPGGARPEKAQYRRECYDLFDTVTVVIAYADSQAEFDGYYDIIYGELLRLHRLFDIYHSYDGLVNLKTVNDSAGAAPVAVDGDILALLTLAQEAYDATGGALNVAMGGVLSLWRDARDAAAEHPDAAALPTPESLERAARHMDIADMVLDPDGGTVSLRDGALSLDVGALAKGYAVQRAVELARAAGLTSGFVNAGGNVSVVGAPADGRAAWSVGVQSPEPPGAAARPLFDVVAAADLAVVTSGGYERAFTVDGVDYHHIIDPATQMPAERYRAVTVLHPDSALAELLSTALFLLPYEDGQALLERYGGEAVWILQDGGVCATPGYRARSAKHGEGA